MNLKVKGISPWGSVSSMLGARIRLEKLRKTIQRSMLAHMPNSRARYDMETELASLVSTLGDLIDEVQHIAISRCIEARNLRERKVKDEKDSSILKRGI